MAEQIDLEKSKAEDRLKLEVSRMKQLMTRIELGGGSEKLDKLRKQGKMTARERIKYLIDEGTEPVEIGAFAGYEMYKEHGGCPGGGVVIVLAYVCKRLCVIVANDASVKAGAWFPITGKKNLRAQEIAMENRIPIIYLVDSAGVYLPMQDEIFPDKEHFGRIFRNNARMSSMGIPQIAAIMGSCVAGGAYLPIMSDEALIVEKNGSVFLAGPKEHFGRIFRNNARMSSMGIPQIAAIMGSCVAGGAYLPIMSDEALIVEKNGSVFLAGPYLVKAAIGEDIDQETLGGATTHCEISGVTDYKMPNDQVCLDTIRDLVDKMGHNIKAGFDRVEASLPAVDPNDIYSAMPDSPAKPYSMKEVLKCLVDDSKLTFYKEDYGKTILCAYARIDGWAVGIVANDRKVVKNAKGEVQIGGVIYNESADKATRFIMNCNQKKIPLVFLHDVTGFMVGSKSEHSGIIKDGAKMVNAVANSTVPKFTVIVGNSYGAGNYAMCGKAYDPRLIVAWPTAKIAVMGGAQAANTLLQIQLSSIKAKGETPDPEQTKEMFEKIKNRYDEQTSAYYAAARLWVDAIIDPKETRKVISMGIEMANHGVVEKFNPGVLQV